MGHNLRAFGSAGGNRNTGPINMGGGPNLVERSLFASNTPNLPYSQWYTPGNGSPAISTADYYLMGGLYWSRPYDLDTMGSEGAAIKAREGMRYVWIMCGDHPLGQFSGSGDFYVGYSNDPQIWPHPSTVRVLRYEQDTVNLTDQNGSTQNSYYVYQTPCLVYNPDTNGVTTNKFWIYAESASNGFQHELGLFSTSDFLTTTVHGPAIPTTAFGGWSSFGRPQRLGVNNWEVYTFGTLSGIGTTPAHYKYTSTDGWAWTLVNSTVRAYHGNPITVNGQFYMLGIERGTNDYLTLFNMDSNHLLTGGSTRISTAYGPNSAYPGPTYIQDQDVYEEDGVASIYLTRGYFADSPRYGLNNGPYRDKTPNTFTLSGSITSNVLDVQSTTGVLEVGQQLQGMGANARIISFGTGSGGTGTYNLQTASNVGLGTITVIQNGGLWQDFIDQYYLITDSTAAASAAPLGVKASCTNGVVTIQWNNCLPHQNYRVYRGTTAGTQATLVGDVTGLSITDSPTPGSQYFYKVVTMNGGEQKSRVVNVYCSNNALMYNNHYNRVINDGGDTTKIDPTFLANAVSWLTTNDAWKYVQWWTDVRFGIKTNGSGFVSKIYDLGTTYLPRGGDYTPTTSNTWPSTSSNTSYSINSFRGTTPSWINNASSAHGYYGNGRINNIQRWNEITLLAAYQRPSGTGAATLFGTGQFASGFFLTQDAGSSGNISFSMYANNDPPASGPITATAAFASATTPKVVAGVFDRTNMTVYLDGTPGTPVNASAYDNPDMRNSTVLRGKFGNPASSPVLCSGGRGYQNAAASYSIGNEALFTGAGLAVFNKGLSQSLIQSWGAMYA